MSRYAGAELDEVRDRLCASTQDVAFALLGKPAQRTGSEWRWGSNFGLKVNVRGLHVGKWHDFDGDGHGDLLALIQRERGCDFIGAVDWARHFLGLSDTAAVLPSAARPKQEKKDRAAAEAKEAAENASRIAWARRLWDEAGAIEKGSAADAYLNLTRGIPRPPAGWPGAVRFHPKACALIVAATNDVGAIVGVQLVYLTPQGQKIGHEEADKRKVPKHAKQSFGVLNGAVVRLPRFTLDAVEPDAIQAAEGPETGLSVWASTGRETWVALGSSGLCKIHPPAGRQLIVCVDDDKHGSSSLRSLKRAVSGWRSAGHRVMSALPWTPRRFDKSDFNDLLKQHGIYSVRAQIIKAITPDAPPPTRRRMDLRSASDAAREALVKARQAALYYDPEAADAVPPVHAIKMTVGGGKSHLARIEYALPLLLQLRAAGDKRNVAIATPFHALSREQAAAMLEIFNANPDARALGLTAEIWLGRNADDPTRPGQKMCRDPQAVQDAVDAGVSDIQAKVCRNAETGEVCPFFHECSYQKQRARRADLWIVAHNLIFSAKPDALGDLAALIVDEAVWRKGLEGVDRWPIELTLDSLNSAPLLPNDPSGEGSARLRACHKAFHDALTASNAGPLSREIMQAHGVSADTGKEGGFYSWRRIVEPAFRPGMSRDERMALMSDAGENRHAKRVAGVFAALASFMAKDGPEFSGWLSLGTKKTNDGTVRVLRRKGRQEVKAGWQVPTVIIDALLDPELLRPYWPQIEVVADIEIEAPHQHVYQVTDNAFAKSRLVPSSLLLDEDEGDSDGTQADDEWKAERVKVNDRRARFAADVLAVLRREARRHRPSRILAVAQKAVEDNWRAMGDLPANLDLAHHNAIAGRDEWKALPFGGIIGRTQPSPAAVEKMAEALTGRAVAEVVSQYQKVPRGLTMTDGIAVAVEADFHPDPVAEAIRWQVCEGELIQIAGRLRGIRRTAENPATLLVMTNVPLPLPLAGVMTWADLAPNLRDQMLSERGFAPESPADASACFPHLLPNPNAAKQAFHKERSVSSSNKDIYIRESNPPLPTATYQKAGAGKRPASVAFDPERIGPDALRAMLEDDVGGLAWFRIDGDDQPPPEQPKPDTRAPSQSSAHERPQEPAGAHSMWPDPPFPQNRPVQAAKGAASPPPLSAVGDAPLPLEAALDGLRSHMDGDGTAARYQPPPLREAASAGDAYLRGVFAPVGLPLPVKVPPYDP